jgi:hypothetical protein
MKKVGPGCVRDLLALRAADNEGSGLPADAGLIRELAARIDAQIAANAVLGRDQLAIDGNDLIVELGMPSGRLIGRLLNDLTERVVAEPALNDRAILLDMARQQILDRQLVENPRS